ncbi:hypothetical protein COBT_003015, partial [Conglomerata obtusa]
EKYEIVINGKNSNSFTNFFLSNSIKLKAFVLKDLFELYFALTNKINIVKNDDEIIKNDDSKIEYKSEDVKDLNTYEMHKDNDKTYIWDVIHEDNPWEKEM